MTPLRFRWWVLAVFLLSSALNALDRFLLGAFTPTFLREFRVSADEFAAAPVVFSVVYALSAPVMGMMLDRLGLRWGTALLVGGWSMAGIATGWAESLGGLIVARAFLGFFEAGGIPASSKAIAMLLPAEERALGSAMSQVGLTIGSSAAPQLAAYMEPRYGWQAAFVVAGLLGFLWIPAWLVAGRGTGKGPVGMREMPSFGGIFTDRRMWVLISGNLLVMTGYSLWTQWTTLFFVHQYGWTQLEANQKLAWIPPIFATLGGFAGGYWAYRILRGGGGPVSSRLRICRWAVVPLALTAGTIGMPSAEWAAVGICACLFFTVTLSVNLYALPLDLFPPERAAFAVSLLTAAYGLTNTIWSKVTGWVVAKASFEPVVVASSLVPLLGVWVLWRGLRDEGKT